MPKILVLAKSGFGKSTSIGHIPEIGIEGLEKTGKISEKTYLVSCTSKPLPFRGSNKIYPKTPFDPKKADSLKKGRRVISDNPDIVYRALSGLVKSPFTNIVIDDKFA